MRLIAGNCRSTSDSRWMYLSTRRPRAARRWRQSIDPNEGGFRRGLTSDEDEYNDACVYTTIGRGPDSKGDAMAADWCGRERVGRLHRRPRLQTAADNRAVPI